MISCTMNIEKGLENLQSNIIAMCENTETIGNTFNEKKSDENNFFGGIILIKHLWQHIWGHYLSYSLKYLAVRDSLEGLSFHRKML